MFDTSELGRNWGDKNLNDLAAAISLILQQSSFDLHSPLTIQNHGSGPAIKVVQSGEKQHVVIGVQDSAGRVLQFGYGYGSRGITANELVPDLNYVLDPSLITEAMRTTGGGGVDPERSLLSESSSGTGVPGTVPDFSPRAGWGSALANLQKSLDTEHAPDSAVKLTRDGNRYWWTTEPWKGQVVRCTVTSINADTLTCNVVANGKVSAETIIVAKPCYLRQTPWDGTTYDSQTYAYSDSQTRTCTAGYTVENQEVYPSYDVSSPCPVIFAEWVGNNTGIANVGWLDMNNDARHWIAS